MKTWTDYGIIIPISAIGPEVSTTCPKCAPTRKKQNAKCLSANIESGVFLCHHCDWRGSLKEGIEDQSQPYKHRVKKYRKPTYEPTSNIPDKVIEWFSGRGIPREVLIRNRVGYEKIWMPQVEEEVMVIRFPFYLNGELVNVKSRDGKKNFRQESGAKKIFCGMDDITGDTAVIVEGEMDKLSCEVAGYVNTLSVPEGAPSPNVKEYGSKFDFLDNCSTELESVRCFILAVDNDEPGRVLQEELARRLGKEKCKRVMWPEGCKDANEVLVKHGKQTLKSCLDTAEYYPVTGVYQVHDLITDMERLYEQRTPRGKVTHQWPMFDDLYSTANNQLTIVTGIPSHGKSEFIDALMVSLAQQHGWKFAWFSPENQPIALHNLKLTEKVVGKPMYGNDRMTPEELWEAQAWMDKHFQFILPNDEELSLDDILGKAKSCIVRSGINGIIIDPYNELDHTVKPSGMSETEYISLFLSKLRRFARRHSVHIWLVAHPTKMPKMSEGSDKFKVPTLYDIAGSAHFYNKADNGITVYREDPNVFVHVQKIRFKHIGKKGVAEFNYDAPSGRYTECQSMS